MTASKAEGSSKNRERFVRLAENRVRKAIHCLRLVGNLSNRNNYSYNDTDVQAIFSALDKEIKLLKKRFEQVTPSTDITFRLEREHAEER